MQIILSEYRHLIRSAITLENRGKNMSWCLGRMLTGEVCSHGVRHVKNA